MLLSTDLAPAKVGFEQLISERWRNVDKPSVLQAIELAKMLMPTYTTGEWDRIVVRMQHAMGMTPTELAQMIGNVEGMELLLPGEATEDEPFDVLVPDGWFRDYLYYTHESEAPEQFHFAAALVAVSGAMNRRPALEWGVPPSYPNIFSLIVGTTGSRKSTAMKMALGLVQESVGSCLNVGPSEGSPQGYAQALLNRNLVAGTGVSDVCFVASEMTVMLGVDKYKTDLHKWLTDWYDCPDTWSRALRTEEHYELVKPYVTFVGASNIAWLRALPPDAVKGGYLPRHLIFVADGKRHSKANPKYDPKLREKLIAELSGRLADLPETMKVSLGAEKAFVEWYETHIARQEEMAHDELMAAWIARKLPHALKVAVVWQIADGGPKDELQEKWMRQAMRLVDWMDLGVMRVYNALGVSEEGQVAEEIVRVLSKKNGRMTQAALIRALRNRWRSGVIQDGLKTLQLAKQVRQDSNAVEGVVWVLRTE